MQTKQKILDTTFNLYMRYGIKSVSMDDISSELGMSKKTLYQHIENKDDLVRQVITKYIEDDEKEILEISKRSKNAIDEMIGIARHVLYFLRQMKPSLIYDLKKYHRDSWRIIDEKHFQQVHTIIRNNLERGIREGLYRSEITPNIIATFYTKVTEIVVDESVFPINNYKHQDLFISHVNYHMCGIVNEQGKTMFKEITLNQ
jgi:AcrR family transcriptional regulator